MPQSNVLSPPFGVTAESIVAALGYTPTKFLKATGADALTLRHFAAILRPGV